MLKGYINSIETMGTVDGPGIRYVIFFQGCPLQCKYCHNRNTWDSKQYKTCATPHDMLDDILKYKSFIKKGGVTFSGGEPTLQAEFCLTLSDLLQKHGIYSIALDTSGYVLNACVKKLLEKISLVLLDIKSIDPVVYENVTQVKLQPTLDFLKYLQAIHKKTWIRHVVVPGLTDNDDHLEKLAFFLTKYKDIVEKVEVLPYHTMGVIKWEQLGLKYPLKDTKPLSKERFLNAKNIFARYGF